MEKLKARSGGVWPGLPVPHLSTRPTHQSPMLLQSASIGDPPSRPASWAQLGQLPKRVFRHATIRFVGAGRRTDSGWLPNGFELSRPAQTFTCFLEFPCQDLLFQFAPLAGSAAANLPGRFPHCRLMAVSSFVISGTPYRDHASLAPHVA